jgi:predicted ferric reductase
MANGITSPVPAAVARRNPGRRPRVRAPRVWPVQTGDVLAVAAFNGLLIVGMWVRHGGLDTLGSAASDLTAAGQLTALLGTYAALVQITLMSRSPWLEQAFGMDRLAHWHRWLGFTTVTVICAHVVFTTFGYALSDGNSFAAETWTLLTTYPYMLMAYAGTALLVLVAVTSLRAARRRLRYETWHFVHFYVYLAIALGFAHQLAVGTDLAADPVARGYWVALYVAVFACVITFRFGRPIRLAARHRLRVSSVVPEGRGVVSVYVTGRDLESLAARAGQFFKWRFLAGDGWWRAHPFSLSAAPNGQYLRVTVKEVGDGTGAVQRLQPGTRVAVEGPFGIFTALRRRRPRVLLVAGGIGITPVRALLEEISAAKGAVTLLYRARSWEDVVFRAELEELIRVRRGTLYFLVGRRGTPGVSPDPFAPRVLRQLVPDLLQRDVYICGPASMMEDLHESLRALRVPDDQIHYERFALL